MHTKVIASQIFAILVLCLPNLVAAQNLEQNILFGHDLDLVSIKKDTEFTVFLSDRITDGCWLGPTRSKSLVERELLDAGYTKIVEDRVWGALIIIEAIGYETTQARCAVHITYILSIPDGDVRSSDQFEWVTFEYRDVASYSVLLTGPKAGISERIHQAIAGFTDELLVDIQQAKNDISNAISDEDASDGAKKYLSNFLD